MKNHSHILRPILILALILLFVSAPSSTAYASSPSPLPLGECNITTGIGCPTHPYSTGAVAIHRDATSSDLCTGDMRGAGLPCKGARSDAAPGVTPVPIDAYGQCHYVYNSIAGSSSPFVPFGAPNDWQQFNAHPPAAISFAECVPPMAAVYTIPYDPSCNAHQFVVTNISTEPARTFPQTIWLGYAPFLGTPTVIATATFTCRDVFNNHPFTEYETVTFTGVKDTHTNLISWLAGTPSCSLDTGGACPTIGAPTVTLAASSTNISLGDAVTLTWVVTNAKSCTASADDGNLQWSGPKDYSGTHAQSVTPTGSSKLTYALTCTGPAGTTSAQVSINVTPKIAIPTVTLTATPTDVTMGDPVKLTWTTTNASSCTATTNDGNQQWSGAKNLSGGQSVIPALSPVTTYSLSCTGLGGTTNAHVDIQVSPQPPAPTVTLTASSTNITAGDSINLSWTVTHAKTCTATADDGDTVWPGPKAFSGTNTQSVIPAGSPTTTYGLTCTGPGGTTPAQIVINVNPPSADYCGLASTPTLANFASGSGYATSGAYQSFNVTGNHGSLAMGGVGNKAILNGDHNSIAFSGVSNCLSVNGNNNSIVISGTYSFAVNGTNNHLTMSGNANVTAAAAPGSTLLISIIGSNNNLTITGNYTIVSDGGTGNSINGANID